MPEERLSKNQRREQARELARLEREKAKRRDRLAKILIPSGVGAVIVAVAVIVVLVIVNMPKPAPISANGPKNMISGGILFTGQDGKAVPTTTAALKKGEEPKPVPTPTGAGEPVNVTTYVDWACPSCKAFEEANADQIQKLVADGTITLEVKPIAIVDRAYTGERFASRVNNAAACIANYDSDSFLKVQKYNYDHQPAEGSPGLSNSQIVAMVHKAGLDDPKVDACIRGESFKNFVTASTQRATADASLVQPGNTGLGTPTIVIGGKLFTGNFTDATAVKSAIDDAVAAQK